MNAIRSTIFGLAAALAAIGPVCAQAPIDIQPRPQSGAKAAPAAPDSETAIERANAYFNSADTMVADFTQTGADGRRSQGKLYVQRPGKMRFEYAAPATLEVVADGTSVAVRDRKLNTQDLYLIGQTPLKFLLKRQIDLSRDTRVQKVASEGSNVAIYIIDKATMGGTSKIKLVFDSNFVLKQWLVTDPQGYDTRVALHNIDLNRKPDSGLFRINQERMLEPN
jgi:outer membrane lipoprotein-sorting protein